MREAPDKVLVANRGEIAVRVIRACHEAGARAVAVYSEPDREALHVRLADEAYPIGGAAPRDSYLAIDRVVEVGRRAGCDAVHPGYGFLSENAAFADAVERAGLTFVGPRPDTIRLMGDKVAARREAQAAGLPVLEGGLDAVSSLDDLRGRVRAIGYPVMLKAASGGGGKGIRVVRAEAELAAAFERASSEARTAFGRGDVYVERFLEGPRHIEVQVLGDGRGAAVHLFERECSLQRRHQKLVEEAPSPSLAEPVRARLCEAAARLAARVGYRSAGTIELLVEHARDPDRARFYFMEMNTRLQVEHPVTEMTTGLDLVREQLRLAAGQPLGLDQPSIRRSGAAIEVRVCAEDPSRGFLPSTGRIDALELPQGPGTRVDTALYAGDRITVHYDPLIAKLIVWGRDRVEATSRLRRALAEARVSGVATTLPLLRRLADSPAFAAADFHIHWLEPFALRFAEERPGTLALERAALAGAVRAALGAERAGGGRAGGEAAPAEGGAGGLSPWTLAGRAAALGHGGRLA